MLEYIGVERSRLSGSGSLPPSYEFFGCVFFETFIKTDAALACEGSNNQLHVILLLNSGRSILLKSKTALGLVVSPLEPRDLETSLSDGLPSFSPQCQLPLTYPSARASNRSQAKHPEHPVPENWRKRPNLVSKKIL